jgi:DNA-binding transcriptional ArsR family regulator
VGRVAFAAARGGIRVLGAGQYSRIRDDEALEHPVRARALEALQDRPGVNAETLAGRVDVSRSAVEHPVRKLIDAGLVTRRAQAGRVHVFERGVLCEDQRHAIAVLASCTARRVLAATVEGPRGVRELACALDRAPSTVSHHADVLASAGLVDSGDEEHRAGLSATSLRRRALTLGRRKRRAWD